ncbi:MAG: outer membrane lipoprotein-sorting protein [Terriglobus sp.]
MTFFARTTAAAIVFSVATMAHAATDPALDKTLRALDAASAKFQSAEADLRWDTYEKVVRETTSQFGSLYVIRKGTSTEYGATLATKQGATPTKYLHYANGKGDMYETVTKKNTTFSTGQDKARAESLLTLGFGGSGKDLEKAWTITQQGTEVIDGTPTTKLDLVPKDPSVANTFTHITIWVDTARDLSLKQVYYTPEGDTKTTLYTNIRYNMKVDTKKYAKK